MPTTIINCGQWHPELEQAFFDDIIKTKQADPLQPVVVLIGSRLLADYLLWRLSELGINSFNIRFVTFTSLGRDLSFDTILKDSRPDLPNLGDKIAVVKGLADISSSHYYDKIADHPGFHNALTNSFNDLDHAGIGRIDKSVSSFRTVDKFDALSHLRDNYLKIVSRFRTTIDNLRPNNPTESFQRFYGTENLYIFGLYDFSAVQRNLLRALPSDIELQVYMPFLTNIPALGYAKNGFSFFKSLIGECIVNDLHQSNIRSFGQHLFQYKRNEIQNNADDIAKLSVFRAFDRSTEIDGIVSRINEITLWNGLSPESIGVLLWNPDDYLLPLEEALDRAGLPHANLIGSLLNKVREGQTLTKLLKLVGRRLKRKDVVDLLSSVELNIEESCDPVMWELISMESGVVEEDQNGWRIALQIVKNRLTDQDHENKSQQNSIPIDQIDQFQLFIERIFDCLNKLPHKGSWGELAGGVLHLIDEFLIASDITFHIKDVISSLSDLDDISNVVKRDDFIEAVNSALGSVRTNRGRYRVDGVSICDRMTARGVRFDVLFIPGLVQGSVPVMPREDPILTDSERIRLNKLYSVNNDYPLPIKLARSDEEKMLFALAVDSAKERLYLSYPANQISGGSLLPSRFLLEMCRIVSGHSVGTDQLHAIPFFEDDSKKNPSFLKRLTDPHKFIDAWMDANLDASQRSHAYHELYSGRSDQFDRTIQALDSRRKGESFTVWDGVMSDEWNDKSQNGYAVTGLERYAQCPFRYLVQSIYQAEPWDEPELLIQPPAAAVGSIIHKVLEKFYQTVENSEDPRASISRIIIGLSDWAKRKWYAPESVWAMEFEFIRDRLTLFIKQQLEQDDPFIFEAAEKKVDREVKFDTFDNTISVHVRGKIDRIDFTVDRKALRIIDYKTGNSKPSKADKIQGGCNLQLPVYLKAMLPLHKSVDVNNCEAQYLHIDRQGNSTASILGGSTLKEREQEVGTVLKAITEGITSGTFPPFPYDAKKMCSTCQVSSICDKRSRKSVDYRLDDTRLSDLITAREVK